jgi:bla regulator protein blaR1
MLHLTAYLDVLLRAMQSVGDSLPAVWRAFSQPAAALALTALWQGTAVALGLALCLGLAPRSPARHRFALWTAAFGALVGLQLLPLISHFLPALAFSGPVAAAPAAAVPHPWLRLSSSWSIVITALWLAASLYRAGDLAYHSLHLRNLWKSAVPIDLDSSSLSRTLALTGRRPPQICTTSRLERPSVIGFFAPRILIPDWLFSRLTPGEFDQIVLHEAEHLRRRDDWTNLLQKFCLILFPLNPALVWIERRLCREREMACDDGVIRITRAPRAYAACLTSLAERTLQHRAEALSLGVWTRRPELVGRIHSILRRKHTLSPAAARTVLAATGSILLLGATGLARCPKLITFAPDHPTPPAEAMLTPPQTAMAQPSPAASLFAAPKRHAIAELPARRSRPSTSLRTSQRASVKHAFPVPQPRSSAPELAALEQQDKTLPAKASKQSANRGAGLIVLTAWESVEMTGPPTTRDLAKKPISGCDAVRIDAAANPEAGQQFTRQITITRMYLRIYPAGPGSKQSATAGYAGWLVIQL